MKILMTASTFPRRADDPLPTFVLDQAVALKASAMGAAEPALEIHVLAPHDAGAAREEVLQGLHVHRFRYAWPESAQRLVYPAILPNLRRSPGLLLQVPLLFIAEFVALFRLCRQVRPDVLYSHWFTPQAVTGALVARLLRIRHVFTTHSSDVAVWHRVPWLGPRIVRAVVAGAAAGTAVSKRTLAKLRSFYPDDQWVAVAHKLHVVPMGVATEFSATVDTDFRTRARVALDLSDRTALVFLGRLTPKKGLSVLLAALRPLVTTHPELLLLIAGEGELRSELEADISHGLAGHVRLLGHVTGERKQQLLRAADIVVVPSVVTADGDAEGLPVSLLEGLAAGRVCVATDASGADDILTTGVDGFIVPAGDAAGLRACLIGVLELDPAARERLEARARHRAAAFAWPVLAPRYLRLLRP